jgi:hypothetical protein
MLKISYHCIVHGTIISALMSLLKVSAISSDKDVRGGQIYAEAPSLRYANVGCWRLIFITRYSRYVVRTRQQVSTVLSLTIMNGKGNLPWTIVFVTDNDRSLLRQTDVVTGHHVYDTAVPPLRALTVTLTLASLHQQARIAVEDHCGRKVNVLT